MKKVERSENTMYGSGNQRHCGDIKTKQSCYYRQENVLSDASFSNLSEYGNCEVFREEVTP